MKRIGALTIGQAPRVDVLPDLEEFFKNVEVLQAGALDGLTQEEIMQLAPEGRSDVLVSRLRDGSWVKMEEAKIIPLLQERTTYLCQQGVEVILMLCTGKFPPVLHAGVPIIYPQQLLYQVVPVLLQGQRLGVLNPDAQQLEQCRRNWQPIVGNIAAEALNPYQPKDGLKAAGRKLKADGANLLVMDCIGYTRAMKKELMQETGLPIVLPRTLLARIVGELITS